LDRVFLDANALFSAAYGSGSRLLELWSFEDIELVTSHLALEEARRNLLLHRADGIPILDDLASKLTVVLGTRTGPPPNGIELAEKDAPILLAATDHGCTHLLTGDKHHFDALFGLRIAGVLVQTPAQYLRSRGA
jgi:uncharacterized protein